MLEALSLLVRRPTCQALVVVGGALLAGACDEYGGGGDPPLPVNSNAFGYGSSLAALIDPSVRGSAVTDGQVVQVTGVRVVHIDTFDETGQGRVGNVFLADAWAQPGPYHAVLAFAPVYSPPSYRAIPGDVVDASGTFDEFLPPAGQPQRFLPELVRPTLVARFDEVGGPLRPVSIPLSDLTKYETGRPWLSTLVTLENVSILELELNPTGRARIRLNAGTGLEPADLPTITNELFDLSNSGLSFEVGQTIRRVTGMVTLFGNFSVAPRSKADIEL
ncbi:MAG TPA: hypothetical protein VFS43_44895 [Polyangiaceae bacterium]|nr:hypothetical protein [Polyangiaceae bacterium]